MITLAVFDSYAAGAPNAGANLDIPADTNGHSSVVAVDNSVDHVDEKNMFVLTGAGVADLEGMLCFEVWMAAGKPIEDVAITVTQPMLDDLAFRAAVRIAQHTVLAAYAHADYPGGGGPLPALASRESDIVRRDDLDVAIGAARPHVLARAKQLYKVVERHTATRREILKTDTATAKFVVTCVPANALHRHFDDKHNWRTKTAKIKNSPAFKALRLAAADQDSFAKFMDEWGHDLWHWLDDESILLLGNVIAGAIPSVMRDWVYLGVNQKKKSLPQVLKITDAVKERMPPGVLGIAAIMTGIKALKAMLNDWAGKVSFDNLSGVKDALTEIAKYVSAPGRTVTETREIRSALTDTLVVSYGYCMAVPNLKEVFEDYRALEALGTYSSELVADGKSLAGIVSLIEPDESVVRARLASVLNTISTSINTAVNAAGGKIPGAMSNLFVPKSAAVRRAEAAELEARIRAIRELGPDGARAAGMIS